MTSFPANNMLIISVRDSRIDTIKINTVNVGVAHSESANTNHLQRPLAKKTPRLSLTKLHTSLCPSVNCKACSGRISLKSL